MIKYSLCETIFCKLVPYNFKKTITNNFYDKTSTQSSRSISFF